MPMVDKEIVSGVRDYLKRVQSNGITVRFAVIFGSRASGGATEWSDIDLLVVSPSFDKEGDWDEVETLWKIAGRVDSRIEPIPCGEKQWQEDEETPIIEIARQQGEIVTLGE